MDFLRFLESREYGRRQKPSLDFLVPKYKLSHSLTFEDVVNDLSSPMSIALNNHLAAVVTEFGNVCILRRNDLKKVNIWQAHHNAIFDTKWRFSFPNQLLTASGDQSLVLWDIDDYKEVMKLEGAHKSSIKSISFGDECIVASGARDGVIKIWDIREAGQEISVIPDAHRNNHLKQTSYKRKKSLDARSDPLNTVTCVLFVPHTRYLYSSGANDATIKLWDLRKLSVKGKIKPIKELPYLGTTSYTNSHGFPSLALDSQNRVYCSCSDHNIYCYSSSDDATSVIKFVGHKANNYTKIKILDDKYLICGATGGKAYLWSLSQVKSNPSVVQPSYFLPHGSTDGSNAVDCVDCFDYDLSIYTCSDDQGMKRWEIQSVNGYQNSLPPSETEVQPFEHEDIELVDVLSTPKILHKPISTPFSLITNWLQVKRNDDVSPINVKMAKKSNSTPRKVISKENHNKSRRLISSKKSLFRQNKKISDYFTNKLTQ